MGGGGKGRVGNATGGKTPGGGRLDPCTGRLANNPFFKANFSDVYNVSLPFDVHQGKRLSGHGP